MSIQIGDTRPSATVLLMGEKGLEAVNSTTLFALIAEDGVVRELKIEEAKQFQVSGAAAMLALVD